MTRKTLGLALGSGGPRGFAHIGVIQALVENNIKIDYIAGTSAGSGIGGMYAVHNDIYEVKKIWEEMDMAKALRIIYYPTLLSGGLSSGENIIKFIHDTVGEVDIKDLKTPFVAISTDMLCGQTYIHEDGDLGVAIRCSSSVPGLLKPYKYKGKLLVDGGVSQSVPVDIVKRMGADIVVAVNLDSAHFSELNLRVITNPSTFNSLKTSIDLLKYHLSNENCKLADLVLNPDIPIKIIENFRDISAIVKKGYKITMDNLPQIKSLLT